MDLTDALPDVIPSVDGLVLRVLARSDLEMSGRQIADAAGASPERVRQVLNRLAAVGLVTARRTRSIVSFRANHDHLLWPSIQRLVIDADQIVHLLKQRLVAIVQGVADAERTDRISLALFGSVARGEAGPGSDVDVLLVTPDEMQPDDVDALIAAIIEATVSGTGNDCSVYAATRSRVDELVAANDPMVPSWIADAQTFHGPDLHRRLTGAPWDAPAA